MARQVISSGGPFEPIYGYSRALRVGAHVHVAGTAARGEALAGDAHVQAQDILGTIRSALEQAGARVEDVVRTVIYLTDIGDAEQVGRAHLEVFGNVPSGQHHGAGERPHPAGDAGGNRGLCRNRRSSVTARLDCVDIRILAHA